MSRENNQSTIPITKSELYQNWKTRLEGNNLTEISIRYKDTSHFEFKDENLDPETLIYEIVLKESAPKEGHLTWGNITVYPGKVKDEYFCTKGHYHTTENTEEYYLCMQGNGLVMYMNKEGDCWCEELEEGSLHHVPEGVARRLINMGETPLMLSTCRPSIAGYDLESVANTPFPCHVYDDNGEMAIRVDIPDTPHSEQDEMDAIEALLKM